MRTTTGLRYFLTIFLSSLQSTAPPGTNTLSYVRAPSGFCFLADLVVRGSLQNATAARVWIGWRMLFWFFWIVNAYSVNFRTRLSFQRIRFYYFIFNHIILLYSVVSVLNLRALFIINCLNFQLFQKFHATECAAAIYRSTLFYFLCLEQFQNWFWLVMNRCLLALYFLKSAKIRFAERIHQKIQNAILSVISRSLSRIRLIIRVIRLRR